MLVPIAPTDNSHQVSNYATGVPHALLATKNPINKYSHNNPVLIRLLVESSRYKNRSRSVYLGHKTDLVFVVVSYNFSSSVIIERIFSVVIIIDEISIYQLM